MNYTDFFQEYQNNKKASEDLFQSLESKFLNEGQVDEALFGLIKGAKDREKELADYYHKITTNAPNWQSYNLNLGGNKFVEIGKATDAEKKQAWNELLKKASSDKFKGGIANEKGVVVYDSKVKSQAQSQQQTQTGATQTQQTGATQSTNYKLIPSKKFKGALEFGGPNRYVGKITMPANSVYENYDWSQSPLKFLFEPPLEFAGNTIAFDLKRNVILNFNGDWKGPFIGGTFVGSYEGNSFKGNFSSKNELWKAQPIAFVDGTFNDTTKTGILGLNNIEEATESDTFNLIQIPAGFSVEIFTNKQLRHTITITKRLDNVDSNFVYSVYMGYEIDSSTPNVVTLPWGQIRQDFNNYQISSQTTSLPDLFSLQSGEQIIELRVLKAGTPPVFTKKEKFDDTKQYSEDVGNLPGLKDITKVVKYNLNFKLNNDKDFDGFNKMKGYVSSPQFSQDLDSVSTYLDNGIINSKDIEKYPYLNNVFDNILSEVNFTGRGRTGKRTMTISGTGLGSLPVVPGTTRAVKDQADIASYLSVKYKDDLAANKKDRYNSEFVTLMNLLKSSKRKGVGSIGNINPKTGAQSQEKESDVILRRLENFIKNFVYKIDAGDKTNEVRMFIINAIKNKLNTQVPAPTQVQPSTSSTASTVGFGAKQTAQSQITANPIKVTESVVRLKIRNILKEML